MDNNKFYEELKRIVFTEFPTDGQPLDGLSDQRGTTEDDIVYAILEKAKTLIPEEEYELRKKIFILKALRMATSHYCKKRNIKDYSKFIEFFPSEHSINVSYTDPETHTEYADTYVLDIIFEIIRFDKNHTDIEAIVPKFIKNNFTYDDSNISYVCYYNDRTVVTYKNFDKTNFNKDVVNLRKASMTLNITTELDDTTKKVTRYEVKDGTVQDVISELKKITNEDSWKTNNKQ